MVKPKGECKRECPHCGEEVNKLVERELCTVEREYSLFLNEDNFPVTLFSDIIEAEPIHNRSAEYCCPKCSEEIANGEENAREFFLGVDPKD